MRSISMLWLALILCLALVRCEERGERLVRTSQGPVRGYRENDIYTFYGIPYATAPTGKNRYKAPLPPPAWLSIFEANKMNIVCPQIIDTRFIGENKIIKEDCLIANVFVPDINGTELPVVVYVHGGGFRIGYGEFFTAKKWLERKEFILVTFNYRLGPHGFLCLGTEDVPGNAGMKDQVALLRWVKENIASFGGNPRDVTIAGYSAGAASVDLLMLSPSAKGLFNKVIPESGVNLGAFNVQINPVGNAKKYARKLNFSNVDDIDALEEFYTTASFEILFTDVFMDTKGPSDYDTFSACVERKITEETFLENSPYSILKSGNYEKLPMLYGFSNMEGLLYMSYFESWKDNMNKRFSDFLPPNLQFENDDDKEIIAKEIKEFYFGDKIGEDNILAYIDYFSDISFVYPTLQAINLHLNAGHDQIYLYEYSFVDEHDPTNSSVVPYTENIRGATHCSQTMALFDGINEDEISDEYLKVKTTLRELWTNFIKRGSPVPEGSLLQAWPATGKAGAPHMSLGSEMRLLDSPLHDKRMRFWDAVYQRHYRPPQAPSAKNPSINRQEL